MRPFEKVLVRDSVTATWKAQIFSHKEREFPEKYFCMGTFYKYCVPYKGNEALLGTTDEPFEDLDVGTAVICRFDNNVRIRAYAGRGGVYINGQLEGEISYPEMVIPYETFLSGKWTERDNIALKFKNENQNGKQCKDA